MEITFDIPDEIIQSTVKDAVMRQVNALVLRSAEAQVQNYRKLVDKTVEAYLNEHLTDEKLKTLVNQAAFEVIKDKLENL